MLQSSPSSQTLPWTTESLPSFKESSTQGINDKKHSCYISMCSWKQAGFVMVFIIGLHYSWGRPFPFSKNFSFIYFWLCFVFTAAHAFSDWGEQGQLSNCDAQASHCSGSWSQSQGSRHWSFSSCSTQVQLPHSMWNFSGPGIEPTSPALAGRFSATGPPRKSSLLLFLCFICCCPSWRFHLPTAKSFVFHGLSPSLNKYMLSINYEPGVLLGAKTTMISKRKTVAVLLELMLVFKKMIHKQIREFHTVISALKEQGRSEWELIPLI